MADQDKVLPIAGDSTASSTIPDLKGKGKAPDAPQDVSMDEAEDTSEEEDTEEEPIEDPVEGYPDILEAIDTENIINDGRRTRGTTIDWAKAAEAAGDDLENEDEDDDEDFEEVDEDDEDEPMQD